MEVYTVSFFGHRQIDNPVFIDSELEKQIVRLLLEKEYVQFLVGRDGDFDLLVSSVIHRCKRTIRNDNSAHVWVLPYVTANYKEHKDAFHDYYDEIEICSGSSQIHPKTAFQYRNREMIDRSDLVIFYVQHNSSGAYQAMMYAQKTEKHIINLHRLPVRIR